MKGKPATRVSGVDGVQVLMGGLGEICVDKLNITAEQNMQRWEGTMRNHGEPLPDCGPRLVREKERMGREEKDFRLCGLPWTQETSRKARLDDEAISKVRTATLGS